MMMSSKALALVIILVVVGAVVAISFVPQVAEITKGRWGRGAGGQGDLGVYYDVRAVVSTVNIILASALLLIYMDTYRRLKSQFTLALILFSLVLLSYSITSHPALQSVFGYGGAGLGPFAMLPDMFACAAMAILIYLSLK
jgi:hypothetical protein